MPITANTEFYPTLIGAPTGMVGDLTYSIERADNSIVLAPSATGIVESAPGSYTATRTSPVSTGYYVGIWNNAVLDISTTDIFEVAVVGLVEAGLRYASPDDLRTWLGQPDLDDSALIRHLRMAAMEVDTACGPGWTSYEDTGLKFVTDAPESWPRILNWQRNRLREATCAQAEYRMTMGNDFMVRDQYSSEAGPDYSSVGQLRKVGGHVYALLHAAGLVRLHGRALGRRRLLEPQVHENRWHYTHGYPTDV